MTYHFWYVDRTHFADSETTLAFIITSFVTELLAGNLRHLISILLSFLFPQEPKSAEPHSVTPLGQGQLKLNQRRAQICPQFCSCPSRFRDTAPAHSWPVLSLSGLVPSARQMLICLPSAKLPLFHHRGQLCRLALGFIVPLFPPNPFAWSHDPKLSWPPPCLRFWRKELTLGISSLQSGSSTSGPKTLCFILVGPKANVLDSNSVKDLCCILP